LAPRETGPPGGLHLGRVARPTVGIGRNPEGEESKWTDSWRARLQASQALPPARSSFCLSLRSSRAARAAPPRGPPWSAEVPPTSSRACQSPPPRTAVSSTYGSYKVWAQRKPLHVEGAHAGPGLGLKPAVMALYRALRRAARLLARALLLSALTAAAAARAALTPRARRPQRVWADMSTANACPKMSGGTSPSAESIRTQPAGKGVA